MFKRIVIFTSLACLFNACFTGDDRSEYRHYTKIDFKNSYQKYAVKDGFVKYQIIDKHTDQSVDTITYEVYFDHYGAEEYILETSKNGPQAFYKKDSIQYQKNADNQWFEQPKPREFNYLFEKMITNQTSRHYQKFFGGKPSNHRYLGKRCNRFHIARLESSYSTNAIFYRGIPLSFHYHDPIIDNQLDAIVVDTNQRFPPVIKIK
ncbi:MAG TPA: hypothetical protein DCS93_00460 [Microscillaceae bacterium]|nr:hypothetical protein [Microscillaceae bacterium]